MSLANTVRTVALVSTLTLPLGAFVHCSDPGSDDEGTSIGEQPIINGATGTAQHAEVILDLPGGNCSATMVSNLWLVTAAHCVSRLVPSQISVTVLDGGTFDFPTAQEIVLHPTLDVALIRLQLDGTPVSGSFYGFNRPIYGGITTSLVGTTVYCTGQGANAYNAATDTGTGAGTLRWTNAGVLVSSSSGTEFFTSQNVSGQIQFRGDSGGGCYTSAGSLVGITLTASIAPSIAGVQSVEGFRDWMRQVLASRIGTFNNGQWWLDVNGTRAWESSGPSQDVYYSSFGAGLTAVTWNSGYLHTAVPRLGPTHIGAFAATGQWYRDENFDGIWDTGDIYISLFGGATGDRPVTGQWLGQNQIDAVGVFRGGPWYLDGNYNGSWNGVPPDVAVSAFGSSSFYALAGSWSGSTGIGRIAVFSAGTWWLDMNGDYVWDAGDISASFGQPTDKPVVGDWNGDGNDKIGVYNSGSWWLDVNGDFTWDSGDVAITGFGQAGDTPVAGRW